MKSDFLCIAGLIPALSLVSPVQAFEPVISLGEGLAGVAVTETTVHAAGGTFDVVSRAGKVLATPDLTDGQFSVVTLAGSAGQTIGGDLVPALSAEAWYVLTGTYEFHVGDRVFEGGPGTFVALDAGQMHSYADKTGGTLLAIYAPVADRSAIPGIAKQVIEPVSGRLQGSYGATQQ